MKQPYLFILAIVIFSLRARAQTTSEPYAFNCNTSHSPSEGCKSYNEMIVKKDKELMEFIENESNVYVRFRPGEKELVPERNAMRSSRGRVKPLDLPSEIAILRPTRVVWLSRVWSSTYPAIGWKLVPMDAWVRFGAFHVENSLRNHVHDRGADQVVWTHGSMASD